MEAETAENIWRQTRCIDLLRGQKIIEIDAEASVAEGCEVLVRNGISSAPVFCRKLNCYVGMLDYRDIVDYVLLVFRKKNMAPLNEGESIEIAHIVNEARSGGSVTAQAVSDLSHKNPFYSVMLESPLSAALEILAADNGVHRVNVVNGEGRVAGILSQSDVVRFLLGKRAVFEGVMGARLETLGLGQCAVLSVSSESPVLDALQLMSANFISSVAVVDAVEGQLIGSISMTDIRFVFQHGRYHRLWMSCGQFLTLALSQKGFEHAGNDQFPFFDAHPTSTMAHVLGKIVATKVHRIWVTEPHSQKLVGVVSLTDIIRTFQQRTGLDAAQCAQEAMRADELVADEEM